MRRQRLTRAIATLARAELAGSAVSVSWGGSAGGGSLLPASWLWAQQYDAGTGQRSIRASAASLAPALTRARVVDGGGALEVEWRAVGSASAAATGAPAGARPPVVLTFPAQWLHACRFDSAALQRDLDAAMPRPLRPVGAPAAAAVAQPEAFDAHALLAAGAAGERAVLAWLRAVNRDGIAVVRGCDTRDAGAVLALAARIAPPQRTIYGESFAVEVARGAPINVAYSNASLELHQDLVYLESPPGLQLLLCREFDASVVGGESTFLDAFAAAEVLRARDPAAFATLARVPTTFQKVHYARERPVHMVYPRPILSVDAAWGGGATAALTGVFWAPPFEGPLRVPQHDVEPYSDAYRAFASLIADVEGGAVPGLLEFRLAPGECVVFNNRRMLHGRRAFMGGARSLQGCYVHADEWASRLVVLQATQGEEGAPAYQRARSGNRALL